MQKRFYLFVQSPTTAADIPPLRVLQECVPLQSHIQVVQCTPDIMHSLPPQVQAGTPVLMDSATNTFSKNATSVIQAMARKAGGGGGGGTPQQQHHIRAPAPPKKPQPSEFGSIVRQQSVDLGDFSTAQTSNAASLVESRSSIGGYGVAGGSFMGMGNATRSASRLNEEGVGWEKATLPLSEEAANRFMADSFGSSGGGGASAGPPLPSRSYHDEGMGKIALDDAEVKHMLEGRKNSEAMFAERQRRGGIGAHGAHMETTAKQDRLAGAEGMQLLRPLSSVPNPDALKNVPF